VSAPRSRRPIHQVLVGAASGDAITTMALAVRDGLRRDRPSEIFANFIEPALEGVVHPLRDLDDQPGGRRDLLIYHASFGVPEVTQRLLARREMLMLAYHNITPAEHFLGHAPQFALGLEWGRHELRLLRSRIVASVADSEFNAQDLMAMGFTDVVVIPAGLDPHRLANVAPDAHLASWTREAFPNGYALVVSQVLPHKRIETVMHAIHLLQTALRTPLGLVIAGAHRLPAYAEAIARHARMLRVHALHMPGAVSESNLATYYRMARVHVTASEHEGLAVPPLEAMSFSVPVVARDAGALRETVGDAGVLLPNDAGPLLFAEAIGRINGDDALRATMVARGHRRLADIAASDPSTALLALIETVP
jgi:L-malate glycosyltransferase